MANYLLHLLVGSIIFVTINIILLPLAYLKTVMVKITLARAGVIVTGEVLSYIFFGMPLLLILQYYDLVNFVVWSTKTENKENVKKVVVPKKHFEIFYKLLV